MKTPITIKGEAAVWLPHWMLQRESASSVVEQLVKGERCITDPALTSTLPDYSKGHEPWLKIGTAEITLHLTPPDDLTADEIKNLQAQLEAERLRSHLAQQAILERISKLQAITFNPGTVEG